MQVKRIPHGRVMVLEMSGKILGGPDFDGFKDEIRQLIDAGFARVVLDLGDVPWVNSSGLGMLITAHHSLAANAGTLKLCNVSDRVVGILAVSRLERVFEVHPDRERAVASFT